MIAVILSARSDEPLPDWYLETWIGADRSVRVRLAVDLRGTETGPNRVSWPARPPGFWPFGTLLLVEPPPASIPDIKPADIASACAELLESCYPVARRMLVAVGASSAWTSTGAGEFFRALLDDLQTSEKAPWVRRPVLYLVPSSCAIGGAPPGAIQVGALPDEPYLSPIAAEDALAAAMTCTPKVLLMDDEPRPVSDWLASEPLFEAARRQEAPKLVVPLEVIEPKKWLRCYPSAGAMSFVCADDLVFLDRLLQEHEVGVAIATRLLDRLRAGTGVLYSFSSVDPHPAWHTFGAAQVGNTALFDMSGTVYKGDFLESAGTEIRKVVLRSRQRAEAASEQRQRNELVTTVVARMPSPEASPGALQAVADAARAHARELCGALALPSELIGHVDAAIHHHPGVSVGLLWLARKIPRWTEYKKAQAADLGRLPTLFSPLRWHAGPRAEIDTHELVAAADGLGLTPEPDHLRRGRFKASNGLLDDVLKLCQLGRDGTMAAVAANPAEAAAIIPKLESSIQGLRDKARPFVTAADRVGDALLGLGLIPDRQKTGRAVLLVAHAFHVARNQKWHPEDFLQAVREDFPLFKGWAGLWDAATEGAPSRVLWSEVAPWFNDEALGTQGGLPADLMRLWILAGLHLFP